MGSIAAPTTGEAQLFERHSDLVYRYCLRNLGSREDAEDAAQTTFFQAVRALRRGVVPTFEQAWLLKIASNECKSRHRAGFRRRQRELTRDPQSLEELAEAPNGGDGRLIGVRHALARLPETQRRALLLREWQGRSYADIAHELGVSRPAVEALLFRARRSLARELGEETKERRHALDVASLLAAMKSAIGGGAAVKVAAGLAAVATVGTVAAGSRQGVPLIRAQEVAAIERPAAVPVRRATPTVVAQPVRAKRQAVAFKAAPATRRKPVRRQAAKSASSASTPTAPTAPGAEQSAPQPVGAEAPAVPSPPTQAPSLPAVPEVPAAPAPQAPEPTNLLPDVPPLPEVQLPQVQVPQIQVPSVPLPEVPDLPIVGDVPILP